MSRDGGCQGDVRMVDVIWARCQDDVEMLDITWARCQHILWRCLVKVLCQLLLVFHWSAIVHSEKE
jgi:hypothetical protein